jgi:cation diffusion facilitator family transporter
LLCAVGDGRKSIIGEKITYYKSAEGKDMEQKQQYSQERAKGSGHERMLLRILVIDIFVCGIRIVVGLLSNSVAMYTTALRASISILVALISWAGMRVSSKGETEHYNYGYGKIESLTSILKGGALLISFAIIIYAAVGRLIYPSPLNMVGAIIAVAFSLFFTCGNLYRARQLKAIIDKGDRSPVIHSQYKSTNVSLLVNGGTLASVFLSVVLSGYAWSVYIDPILSILLSGYILFTAYAIFSSSVTDLLDKTLDESIQFHIMRALAEYFEEYNQVVAIRSRQSGGLVFIEIVLEFDGDKKLADIQKVTDLMQRSLEGKISDSRVTIIPRAGE